MVNEFGILPLVLALVLNLLSSRSRVIICFTVGAPTVFGRVLTAESVKY